MENAGDVVGVVDDLEGAHAAAALAAACGRGYRRSSRRACMPKADTISGRVAGAKNARRHSDP
jgi:hypothetical protein